jgi:hypothetical protein
MSNSHVASWEMLDLRAATMIHHEKTWSCVEIPLISVTNQALVPLKKPHTSAHYTRMFLLWILLILYIYSPLAMKTPKYTIYFYLFILRGA